MRVHIGPLTAGGEAAALLPDGRIARVRGGCPGDIAELELVRTPGPHPEARILSLLEPSPDRVDAPCPYFGECSGCQWQHVSPSAQLEAKSRIVSEALAGVPGFVSSGLTAVAAPEFYGYRNQLTLTADDSRPALRLGIPSVDGRSIIPVERCLLLPEESREVPRRLAGALGFLSGRHGPLALRTVSIRISRERDETEVGLWTDPGPFPRHLAGKMLADAVGASSVVRVLLKGGAATRQAGSVEVLSGRGWWAEDASRRRFVVSAPSPFPPNTPAASRLVNAIVAGLRPTPSDSAIDTHAGVGLVAEPLAKRCARVVAIDASRFSLADLRRNVAGSACDIEVIGGDPLRELPSLGRFDLLVVSPPAAGLREGGVATLAGARARALAYVSCDPVTLARDAALLSGASYLMRRVELHDLTPQTSRAAVLALFERQSS